MSKIAIIYYSGYGHTAKLAESLMEGVRAGQGTPVDIRIPDDGVLGEADWDALTGADAVIYGSPTYMGSVAWQFKRFADESSKLWMTQSLSGRIAGGFTVSASTVGDKGETMSWLMTFAQQHGQLWAGPALMPDNTLASTPNDANWTGFSTGLMAIARADEGPDQAPRAGDLRAGQLYGRRIAELAARQSAAMRAA